MPRKKKQTRQRRVNLNELTCVIPVYGQEYYLDKCLRSLQGINTIIVDDCSPEVGTRKYLELATELFPNVTLYRNKENRGFAKTVNKGMSHVETEFACILNSDIEFYHGAVSVLDDCVKKFRSTQNVGIMGIRLLYEDDTLQHGGVFIDWSDRNGNPRHRYQESYGFDEEFCKYEETFGVTGACMILRKSLFYEAGKLPAVYGRGYYEDSEFTVKVRQLGYKVMYNGEVWAYHYGHRSFMAINHDYDTKNYNNFRKFQERNLEQLKAWKKQGKRWI